MGTRCELMADKSIIGTVWEGYDGTENIGNVMVVDSILFTLVQLRNLSFITVTPYGKDYNLPTDEDQKHLVVPYNVFIEKYRHIYNNEIEWREWYEQGYER